MTLIEVNRMLAVLVTAYPYMVIQDETAQVWHLALGDLRAEIVTDVVRKIIAEMPRPPSPADIRRYARQLADPSRRELPTPPERTVPPEQVTRIVREAAASLARPRLRPEGDVAADEDAWPTRPPVKPTGKPVEVERALSAEPCVFCNRVHTPLPAGEVHRRCAGSGTKDYSAAHGGWATCRVCKWPIALDADRVMRFHENALDREQTS